MFFTLFFHFHQEALLFLFTFYRKGAVICIFEVIDISPSNLDSSLCLIQPGILPDVLLSQFWKSPIQSGSNCCLLTCIQVSQEADKVVWYFHLFKNFPQFVVIHTVKGFGIVNKAEIDLFLELSSFSMIQQILVIWSLVPLPFLKPAWTSETIITEN